MPGRLWLAACTFAVGASLLVAASPAGSDSATTTFRQGGTLRVNLPGSDIDDIDPSLAYGTATWHIEYSTALKLLNYPDAPGPRGSRLVPEGASSFRVSQDGTKYTFTIRKGFRFSNGEPVTAQNYAFALNRAMSRDLYSPGFQFIGDARAANIVGAQDVWEGKSLTARGVRVKGNQLIVRLAKPEGTFLAKISMPFFQALPLSLPRRLSTIDIKTQANAATSYQEVRANQADYTYDLPRGAPDELGREFGLKGRFRVRPSNCISYIAMNSMSPLFRDNPQLRRAVNYVIDRTAIAALYGAYKRIPTDQYLPRGFPGFKDIDAYPMTPDLPRARALARGHVPSGGPWRFYYGLNSPGPQVMELIRASLEQIGIRIEPMGFRAWWWPPDLRKPNWAFFGGLGWCQDYSDPFDFINVLLHTPANFENSNNIANFEEPAYDARMDRAAKLIGPARRRAYEKLEHDLVTKAAPWAATGQPAHQFFFSDSVDMRSFAYQPIYEVPPYNLLALK